MKAKAKQVTDGLVLRERTDQHVPDDRVDLSEWATLANEALCAAQLLHYYFSDRTSFLRHRRGDPPASLADLTTGKIMESEKAEYRRRVGWRQDVPSTVLGLAEAVEALRADGLVLDDPKTER